MTSINQTIENLDAYFLTRPPIFEIVFWASVLLLALILLALVYLLYSRVVYLRKQKRIKAVEKIWLPILKPSITLENIKIDTIRKWQYPIILDIWENYRSIANRERAQRLDQIAVEIGLDTYIADTLSTSSVKFTTQPVWLRMLAITSAKWLRSDAVIKSLWQVLDSHNRFLAVSACTCLIQLRAENFEKAIIKILFRYPESAATVTSSMGAAGGAEILHLLHSVLDKLPHYTVMNFIALAERSKDPSLAPILVEKLHSCTKAEEASALIRSIGHLGGSEHREYLHPFLNHENQYLRIQAAKSLGRIGDETDIPLIEPLLSHEDWWVRYRSAEAIVDLSGNDRGFIEQLIQRQQDRFAIDILRHAYKEKEWCLI